SGCFATGAFRFPVDIGGDELVGALEEEAIAVGGEVAAEVYLKGGDRVATICVVQVGVLQVRSPVRRGASRVAGDAGDLATFGVIAVVLRRAFAFVARQFELGAEDEDAAVGADAGGLRMFKHESYEVARPVEAVGNTFASFGV